MSERLFRSIVVPIADESDAESTARAIAPHVDDGDDLTVVHVVEKAGGAIDKASVEQRELYAEDVFESFRASFDGAGSVETEILYGTDVAGTIHARAAELDASAIVFTTRGLSRWKRLLAGDVRKELVDAADRPVVVLPTPVS